MKPQYSIIQLFFFLVFWSSIFAPTTAHSACGTVNSSFTTSQIDICGPGATTISFTNTSTGVSSGTADYQWFLNGTLFDNTTGLAAPNNSNISAVGTYTYMMIAIDATVPCRDTAIVTVVIHPVPNADFTFGPNNVCAGTPISFNNNSSGANGFTTYNWNFGDGNTSNAANPNHTYNAGGTYNVTLTMTNAAGCVSTHNLTATMMDIPNVGIAGDDGDGNTTYCLLPGDPTTSEVVTFTNTTTGAVSYDWDFGDGSPIFTTASNAAFTHNYTSFGTFTVTMTATHANGCTATATLIVVFEKFVSAALTLDITEYSGCAPHNLSTLMNLSVNANNYVWDFGDGTVINTTVLAPPAYSYTANGTYTITLTASNSCNTATATISPIIIIDAPTAGFTPSTTLGCAPQNVTFVNTSTGAVPANNYQWDMGNGNTYSNTTTPPAQTYGTTGTYTVELIAGNSCGNDTVTQIIQIDTVPTVDLTVFPLEGCTPLSVNSTAVGTGGNLTWQWFVDGAFVSNNPNTIPDEVFTTPPGNAVTNHTIQVNVSNQCGNDTDIETIIVHPTVQAIFTANDTICEGGTVTFTDGSLGDNLSWAWDFGNGNTAATQGPHSETYLLPGTYTVSLTVTGYCGVDVMTMDIVVIALPLADIGVINPVGCENEVFDFTNNSVVGASSYTWEFGAEAVPSTSNLFTPPSITYIDSGLQMIVLHVDTLGCVNSDTDFVSVNPLPGPSFTLTPNDGCTDLDVAINNTTAFDPGDIYSWDFGNGNTSSSNAPGNETFIALANDSIYNITLIITTAAGCVDSITQNVTVHPLPLADFTILPDTVCAQETVGFLNNSAGASTYVWDFGDGNTSPLASPSHSYTNPGNYTVQLIAFTAFNCTDTLELPVVVDSIPIADFTFSIECVGTTTQFSDASSGGITSWAWDFGDGSPIDNNQNPQHLYAASGNYNVSLTVTNAANCAITVSQLVTVNDVPVANFSFTPSCLGQNMQFTDLTTGVPISWTWDFGDGSPVNNNQNPSYQYTAIGNFNVELIVGGGSGCFDTLTIPVQVDSIPTANFTFTNVCANDTTFFISTSTGGADTYFWDFDDGNTDATNSTNVNNIYTNDGSYNVMLVAGYAASGCTDTSIQVVDAFPRTVPDFSSNTPCLGASTNFIDLTANTPNSWTWDFDDGSPFDFTQNPSHVYALAGVYNVMLITENTFNCVDTAIIPIEVYPLPTSSFSFDTICEGFATQFSDLSNNTVSWEWNFNDGSGLDFNQSPSHVFPNSGVFNVQLVVTNIEGCTDTLVSPVDVNPNPSINFSADTACFSYLTSFTDLSSPDVVSWNWDFGDGSPINNSQNPSYTYANDGVFNTQLIASNNFGCLDSVAIQTLVLPQPEAGFTNINACAGDFVDFTDTTLGFPDQWTWDFGDGSPVNNNQNPSHNYALGGQYNVQLIAGNSAGCFDTTIIPVDVFTVPTPAFTADSVCYLDITNFTDASVDAVAISSWFWDFGDNINQSSLQNPGYIYQAPGIYNVDLTVTNVNGCDSTITVPIIVYDIPVADFTFDTVCVGSPTTFTDQSTGVPLNWTWDFGDGNTSTNGPIESHVYAQAGSYLVQMVVDGGAGCTDQAFHAVIVSDAVAADFIAVDSACLNSTVSFTDNSTITIGNISAWSWDFGDGSPVDNNQNTNHVYTAPGTYTVVLTVTSNAGCTSTFVKNIDIHDLPIADFIANVPCEGQATNFVDQSNPSTGLINLWQWTFGDGSPSDNTQNPSHVYGVAGIYNVELIVENDMGCRDTISNPVQIYPQPTADFTNNVVCGGDSTMFSDLSTVVGGTLVGWDWSFGSSLQNPGHDFPSTTDTFSVQLIVTTDLGCVDSITKLVQTLPVVNFDYGPLVTSGCPVLEVDFSDISTTTGGGGITNWLWDMGDGFFSFGQNPIHSYSDSGNYYVSLSVTTAEGCTYVDTLTYPIVVFPQPIAMFDPDPTSTSILDPTINFTNQSIGAVNYEWDFGDASYSNDFHTSHDYGEPGYYDVILIATNHFGCSDTAVVTIEIEDAFTFYVPNAFTPNGDGTNDVFGPEVFGQLEYKFLIFDRWGQLMFESTDPSEKWDGTFNGKEVPMDVYVWRAIILDRNREGQFYRGHVTVVK